MTMTGKTARKILPAGIAKVLKRLHYPLDVILLCARWYVTCSLSLRNLEEMMAERLRLTIRACIGGSSSSYRCSRKPFASTNVR